MRPAPPRGAVFAQFRFACAEFHEDNVPEEWKDFTALNAEMSPQCPVITEKKEPLAGKEE